MFIFVCEYSCTNDIKNKCKIILSLDLTNNEHS